MHRKVKYPPFIVKAVSEKGQHHQQELYHEASEQQLGKRAGIAFGIVHGFQADADNGKKQQAPPPVFAVKQSNVIEAKRKYA